MRIAVAGFQHETNTFGPSKADWRAFELGGGWPGICYGDQIAPALRGANIPAAGFIESALADGQDLVPMVWAAASPSAQVEQDVFEKIVGLIVDGLRHALPVDAVYLDLHGAMVAEHCDDGDGEILARVRALVGSQVPVLASLDLHGNVTQRMLENADVLVSYRTYPHVDMAETGKRTYVQLLDRVKKGRPALHARRVSFLIPPCWQSTDMAPAKGLYALLEALEQQPGVSCLSFNMGFPAADFPECGPVVFGYGDSPAQVRTVVDGLYQAVVDAAGSFSGKFYDPDEAVLEALRHADAGRPTVIADAQDNPGAGADSDTTGILRALLRQNAVDAALGLIVDPESAAKAFACGAGNRVRLAIGGKSGVPQDAPFEAEFLVEQVSDGKFMATGDYYGGCHMDLGPSACLRIEGVRIVLASYKAQMADQAMFRYVGIDPLQQKILVVKSTAHFRADFTSIARDILVCLSPGPMPMRLTEFPWTRLPDDMLLSPTGPSFATWRRTPA